MASLTGSIAIGYTNHASGKVITTTTAATGYPATDLSNSRLFGPGAVYRSTTGSLTTQNIDVDLASAQNIDIIALIGNNLSDAATRIPVTSENSGYTSPEYNPGSANVFDLTYPALISDIPRQGRNLIILPGTTLNSRYVRVTLNDSGNTNNFISSRVYWVGSLWQPTYSFQAVPDTYRKKRELIGSPGVQRYITILEVDLPALSEAEGRALESLCSARLTTGRLMVLIRPDQPATWQGEVIYCTLVGLPTLSGWPQGGGTILWKVTLIFRECED